MHKTTVHGSYSMFCTHSRNTLPHPRANTLPLLAQHYFLLTLYTTVLIHLYCILYTFIALYISLKCSLAGRLIGVARLPFLLVREKTGKIQLNPLKK